MKFKKEWLEKPWVAYTTAICSGVVLYLFLSHLNILWTLLGKIAYVVSPVIAGLVIAYVLDPMVRLCEQKVLGRMRNRHVARNLSVLIVFVGLIVLIVIFLVALVPQLISSVRMFLSNVGAYGENLNSALTQLTEFAAEHNVDISEATSAGTDMIGLVLNMVPDNLDGILGTTISYGVDAFNRIISCIIAAYLLADKEGMLGGAKRLHRAVTSERSYQKSMAFLGMCNIIMIRYIVSDLLDGLIIGILNAVFMMIARMPYVTLLSVVVGVTNLVPTFGPVVGAIIGAGILVLIDPWQALAFLIFTVCLQTIDGYVIKPKLFGDTMGIPSIWILISIIVGSRMLGLWGILLSIPCASIFHWIYQNLVHAMEVRKGLAEEWPTDEWPEPVDTSQENEDGHSTAGYSAGAAKKPHQRK